MEEKETKTISFSDIGKLLKSNVLLIVVVLIASLILGACYAVFVQPTKYTATILLEVFYKEDSQVGSNGATNNGSEKDSSDSSIYSFARYLPKGYEKRFTSPAYIDDYNKKVDEYNKNNPDSKKQRISGGGLTFVIDEELDVLFSVTYTVSNKGLTESEMKTLIVDTLNNYIKGSILKTNLDEKSVYADRLNVISPAMESTVTVDKGYIKCMAIALLAGVVICFVILLIKYLSNDTVSEKADVEELTETTVIAFIPLTKNDSKNDANKNANTNKGGEVNV